MPIVSACFCIYVFIYLFQEVWREKKTQSIVGIYIKLFSLEEIFFGCSHLFGGKIYTISIV